MKQIIWLVWCSFSFIYSACSMAEANVFVHNLCIPEYGFVKYEEIGFEVGNDVTAGQIKTIEDKHGLFELGDYGLPDKPVVIEKSCQLGKLLVKAKFQYAIPGHGPCGASPSGRLSLWANEKLLINDVSFGEQCFGNGIGVHSVSVTSGKHPAIHIEYEHDKSISVRYAAEISEHFWFIENISTPITMDTLNKEAARVKSIYKSPK